MRSFRFVSFLLAALLLGGCLSPRLDLTISPAVLEIVRGQEKTEDIQLRLKMSGFSSAFWLERVEAVLLDENGEEVLEHTKELNISIPIVSGVKRSQNLGPLDLSALSALYENEEIYDKVLRGKEYLLRITVFGTKTNSADAKVQFK